MKVLQSIFIWKWLVLTAIVAGLLLRIAPYWTSIFTGGYINFASPDSYYQINYIALHYADFPHIAAGDNVYHWLVAGAGWLLSWGHGDIRFVETIAVFVPLFLFVITVPLIYFIGKEMFSPRAGVISAFIFALLPGEYFTRSLLGEIDYHAFEVFISTLLVLLMIHSTKFSFKSVFDNAFIFLGAYILCLFVILWLVLVLFAVYFNVWSGAALFLPILAAFVIPLHKKTGFVLVFLALIVSGLAFLSSGITLFTIKTTSEAQPGYSAPFPLLHVILAAIPLYLLNLGRFKWPLIVWTGLLIAATLMQLRFDYYLIIPLALLSGMALDKLWPRIKKTALPVILAGCFCVLCLPGYILTPKLFVPSAAWHDALSWVKTNTPEDALIVSWWDYGYWIRYIGERAPYSDPGQDPDRIRDTASWFVYGVFPGELTDDNVYLVIDLPTARGDFDPAMKIWLEDPLFVVPYDIEYGTAPLATVDDTFIFSLMDGRAQNFVNTLYFGGKDFCSERIQYRCLYTEDEIEVFEVRKSNVY